MRRALLVILLAGGLFPALGCGGGGERGKNQDLDKPKAAATKK